MTGLDVGIDFSRSAALHTIPHVIPVKTHGPTKESLVNLKMFRRAVRNADFFGSPGVTEESLVIRATVSSKAWRFRPLLPESIRLIVTTRSSSLSLSADREFDIGARKSTTDSLADSLGSVGCRFAFRHIS
jgi:hypothetical protein